MVKARSSGRRAQWKGKIRALASALLFALTASLLLQNVTLGAWLTISLALHELGHVMLLERLGINWEVRFGVFGAATLTPREERRQLDHYQNSMIHLAGPLANLAQALASLLVYAILQALTGSGGTGWLRAANFAGLIALLNFLPLGDLSDGGKFARRLFASLSEPSETQLLWRLMIWLLSLSWLMAVSRGNPARAGSTLTVGVWYVAGMLFERHHDDPADAVSPRAMSLAEALHLFTATSAGLLLSTALVVFLPFWLTRAQAQAIADAASALLSALLDRLPFP